MRERVDLCKSGATSLRNSPPRMCSVCLAPAVLHRRADRLNH